jgi:hypothetical protein
VVPINLSLLTKTVYSSVTTTLIYNDTNIQSLSWRYNGAHLYYSGDQNMNSEMGEEVAHMGKG